MADPFVAEIRIFTSVFAPKGWAFCNGALLPLAQNTALFSLLGTTYGGDGRTTFALPDLQGRAPMHTGAGPGLTNRVLGEAGGQETVTLAETQIPQHTHTLAAVTAPATANTLSGNVLGSPSEDTYVPRGSKATVPMSVPVTTYAGDGGAHNNMQPYLALAFIIALEGVFPQRPT